MKRLILYICFVFLFVRSKEQTYIITHDVPWATYYQNMWGPNGSPFSIDFHYELFNINFADSFSLGYIADFGWFGDWGAMVNFNLWLLLGSDFDMYGWTTGWVDVKYPVRLKYEIPNNYTFNPGEIVTIRTSYQVLPGWELNSQFPQAGVISLDLDYGFGIDINVDICVYNCANIQLINLNVPPDSFYIFYLNGQTGEVAYPCYDPSLFPPFTICHDDILPITFNNLFGIGLSGWITLPYIPTEDWLNTSDPCHQILGANGDSTYAQITLDIIQFLYFLAGFIPPPQGPVIQQFLQMLNGSYNFGIITIQWNLLSAYLQMTNTLQQDLTFNPTVLSIFTFPLPVEYWIHDPQNGNQLVEHGISDSIPVVTCMDFSYKYPCFNWPQMPIGLAAHLDNEFTNHVWDSIAFDFIVQALEFTIIIDLPFKNAIVVPEFCLPLEPIKDINDTIQSVPQQNICIPAITGDVIADLKQLLDSTGNQYHDTSGGQPPMQLFDWTFHFGPLINISLPLGYIPFTWYENTWELAGFHDTIFPGFVMIPNPEFQIVSVTHTNNICAGDSIGTITINVANGTPPYVYSISTGITDTVNSTTYTFTGLVAGTYSVTVSDINGCSHTANVTIIETNPPISITLIPVNVLCHGDSTGIIYSQVTGGTPPYSYTWLPMGGNNANATNLPAGQYTLIVTDAVGCTKTATTTITEPATEVQGTVDSVKHILCYGQSTGAIYISVWGGTPPYTYLWPNGSNQQDLINVPANTYTVTISDANHCTLTITETVNQPPMLAAFIMPTNVTCYGFSNGSANLIVAGGTPPYQYQWNTGATTEDISNLPAGTYSVTITDSHGCTITTQTVITQPQAPLSATYSVTDVLCHGFSTGIIDLTPSGGTPPYSYYWSNGVTTQDNTGVPAGNYSVTIVDFNGCSETYSMSVSEPSSYVSITMNVHDIRCYGEVNGFIDLTITGGVPPYSVHWSNNAGVEDISSLTAGWYSVTVTDSHGCTITDSAYVNEPGKLYADVSQNQYICINDTAHLYVSATGGVPPYSYMWNTGSNTEHIYVTPSVTTVYVATVTDAHGCTVSNATTVYVYPPINANIVFSDTIVCKGNAVIINANIIGGNGNYIVMINDSVITLPYTFYPTTTNTYTIHIEDNCNTPPYIINQEIEVEDLPPNGFLPDITEGCAPLTVHFVETTNEENLQFEWNFGDPYSISYSNSRNPVYTYTHEGTYSVTLTTISPNGCKNIQTIPNLIKVYPKPIARFTTDPIVINMINTNVHFINLSTGANQFYWSFGDGDSSLHESPYHEYPMVPASYNVTLIAISDKGCRDTAYMKLDVIGAYTFYAPTAFTPDDDGVNETWRVYASNIKFETFNLKVYDRWGAVLFETTDINKEWNGCFKDSNQKVPVGSYNWMATFRDLNGIMRTKTGSVTVIY
ncbi:MAG: PKD domain-containing protein [Bacteroidales bacterium]|nr:PKD domain-containing protein [Bacteroidales bacterium]